MKRSVLSCLILLAVGFLLAQQPVLLRNSQFLDFEGHKIDLPGGATMIFWNDTSSGSSDVLAQKISAEGNVLWTAPRPVANGHQEQRVESAVLSSDQNIIVLYYEYSMVEDENSFRVQKISQAGQPLWGAEGVEIGSSENHLYDVVLVPNTIGAAYVIYKSTAVYGMNLDNFGTNLWPHIPLCNFPGTHLVEAFEDGVGGVIINSKVYISGEGYHNRLIRYNSAGDVVGPNPLLDPAALVPEGFTMIRDSEGNYFLHSYQNDGLQLQKMDVNGNLLLPNIVTIPRDSNEYYYSIDLKAAPDGGLLYSIRYNMGANEDYFIKLYYLGANLQTVWAQPVSFPVDGNPNSVSMDATDGFWLSWAAWGVTDYSDDTAVYCTRIDASGTISFAPQAISNLTGQKLMPIIKTQPSKALLIWNDLSTENNGLRCQMVTNSGSQLLEPEGRDIYGVLNGGAELKKIHNLGGNYLQIYDDNRYSGENKLYYQLTSANGEPLLEENGKALNSGINNWERYLDSKISPNNTIQLLYSSYAANNYTLWLQEINFAGNTLWPGNGISVSTSADVDFNGSMLGQLGNDILVAWPALIPGTYYQSIYGQLYANGNPQWPASGKMLIDSGNLYSSLKAVHGDYLVYLQENSQQGTMCTKALKINANGDPYPGWPAEGIDITPSSSYYAQYLHSGIVNGDLVVFNMHWDLVNMKTSVQKISPAGQFLWGQDGLLLVDSADWLMYRIDDADYDNDISFIMHNNDTNEISLHKLNQAGEMPWGASGCLISPANSNVQESKLLKYANGSYGVFFSKVIDDHFVNLFRQNVSAEGTLINAEPVAMLGFRYYLNNLHVSAAQNSGLLSWNDYHYYERGEAIPLPSLWTIRVDASPVDVNDLVSPVPIYNLSNYPNPFRDNTSISFGIKETARVKVDIYNLKGQHVRSLMDEAKPGGDYLLSWDGHDATGREAAAGIYFYKIQAGTFSSRKKMILLK